MERMGVAFLGDLPPPDLVECIKLAEDLGYESAWMCEGRCGDQFSILTAAALSTERILLGTSITSVFVRTPTTIGMAACTVDHFSGGRFILGVGSDHKAQVGPMHSGQYHEPIQRLRETVDIARELIREGVVRDYKGEVLDIEYYDLWFEPLRREIPIYVAAVVPKMLKIAGGIGQGVMSTWHTVENASVARECVDQGAVEAGREAGDVDLAQMIPTYVAADGELARERMRYRAAFKIFMLPRYRARMAEGGFGDEVEVVRETYADGEIDRAASLVPDGLIEEFGLVGTPEEARAKIEEFRMAGVTLPMLSLRTPPGVTTSREDAKAQFMESIRACAPAG
jgi:alkanesulfonate monooxygenase SsuD/methylene tetrahydromethanopterin reductase-like flavin-dependent oxidoreductase (luciferase family)